MSERVKIGEIQGYDVLYIPEKDIVFCKNTAVKVSVLDKIVRSSMDVGEIPEKNLTITKDNGTITFGCLTTTYDAYKQMKKEINKFKL
jgi:hypothetical protein|nr:MAG TPA: hypothetical protein [Caudoviricetes sp.]